MALMLRALNDALLQAGATPDVAAKASEEVAGFENRLAKVEADLGILKWMVGFNIGLTVAVMFLVLRIHP